MTPRNRSAVEQSSRGVAAANRLAQARPEDPDKPPGVEPKFAEGHQVSWHQHEDLPRGIGVIHETKVHGTRVLHMVRDRSGNVHALPEHKLRRLDS